MSIFNQAPTFYKPKVNKFKLNQEVLTTAEMGNIYPVMSEVMLPNSFFKVSPACVIKTAPMYAPIYSPVKVHFAAFAVPLRLLWDGFNDWIYDPQNTEHMPPHISEADLWKIIENSTSNHSLANDFDIPTIQASKLVKNVSVADNPVSIQDFLAYHLIWQEYFRNEYLQDESAINADISLEDYHGFVDDDDLMKEFFIHHRKCNFSKDYFTSALPTPQYGSQTFLSVLRETHAPVNFELDAASQTTQSGMLGLKSILGETLMEPHPYPVLTNSSTPAGAGYAYYSVGDQIDLNVYADLSLAASGISVSDFRSLFAVQSYLEQLMIGGNRLREGTLSFYGTRVKDARALVPEFLGIDSTYVMPQEVVAHEPDELGQLGAFGKAVGGGQSFRYYATEHSVFMIVMYLKPKSLYCQGLPKKFRLLSQLDFPIQLFQHLGEEAVTNEEIFYQGDTADQDEFGYQSRFAYWRSNRDRVRGDFATTLKDWHLARFFSQLPELDEKFIQVDPNEVIGLISDEDKLNRVFNYTGKAGDHFWVDIYFKFPAKLPLRYHSKPMLIG